MGTEKKTTTGASGKERKYTVHRGVEEADYIIKGDKRNSRKAGSLVKQAQKLEYGNQELLKLFSKAGTEACNLTPNIFIQRILLLLALGKGSCLVPYHAHYVI